MWRLESLYRSSTTISRMRRESGGAHLSTNRNLSTETRRIALRNLKIRWRERRRGSKEGMNWELEFVFLSSGKIGLDSFGLGFGNEKVNWDWDC